MEGGGGGRGGGFTKNQYSRGAWTVCRFKGGGLTRGGGVFEEGVDTPMHTIITVKARANKAWHI